MLHPNVITLKSQVYIKTLLKILRCKGKAGAYGVIVMIIVSKHLPWRLFAFKREIQETREGCNGAKQVVSQRSW